MTKQPTRKRCRHEPKYDDYLLMYFCRKCHKHIPIDTVYKNAGLPPILGWIRAYAEMGALNEKSTKIILSSKLILPKKAIAYDWGVKKHQ